MTESEQQPTPSNESPESPESDRQRMARIMHSGFLPGELIAFSGHPESGKSKLSQIKSPKNTE